MTKTEKVSYIAGLFADHLMIFQLFINYWEIVSGIGQEYIDQTAFSLTSNHFEILRHRWEQNNWDIKDIEKICSSLDNLNEMLNPNLFFNKDHIKSWHQLEFFL